MSNKITGQYLECAGCHKDEFNADELTWQLTREEISISDVGDLGFWMNNREGIPPIIILPDDGGILAYSVAQYCGSCLDENFREYEEQHTPPDKVTKGDFMDRVVAQSRLNGWIAYILRLNYLSPRGFPDLALVRDDQFLLRSVRGDVTSRSRAFHPPAQSILISPEVPQELRENLLRSFQKPQSSESVAFLYMDEKYLDTNAPSEMQVTSLTGLFIEADKYTRFRERIYRILPDFQEGASSFNIDVHASNLFRDRPDKEHFEFYNRLVSIINELGCRVYRRGFNFIPSHPVLRKKEKQLLSSCYRSMLIAVLDFEDSAQIWPVIEIDRSEVQDRNFAGYTRWTDQATAFLQMTGDGVEELIDDDYMVDNSRLGDFHYVNKRSIIGCAVDCLVYLLHQRWLDEMKFPLTAYKAQLAEIASSLHPSTVNDFVGSFRTD